MLPQSCHVLIPPGLGLGRGLDGLEAASAEISMQSEIHSTCCSMETVMLDSTEGLPGPGDHEEVGEAGGA